MRTHTPTATGPRVITDQVSHDEGDRRASSTSDTHPHSRPGVRTCHRSLGSRAARRLEGERCRAIQHPDLGAYFDAFAPGVGYVPNERMQRTYPHDAQARRDALALADRGAAGFGALLPAVARERARAVPRAVSNNPLAAMITTISV